MKHVAVQWDEKAFVSTLHVCCALSSFDCPPLQCISANLQSSCADIDRPRVWSLLPICIIPSQPIAMLVPRLQCASWPEMARVCLATVSCLVQGPDSVKLCLHVHLKLISKLHVVRAYRWRFTKTSQGRRGLYVKVNHWPALSISRTEDWGWRMENCWVVYLTIPKEQPRPDAQDPQAAKFMAS